MKIKLTKILLLRMQKAKKMMKFLLKTFETELEDNTFIDTEKFKNKSEKISLLIFQNSKKIMNLLIMKRFFQLKTLN